MTEKRRRRGFQPAGSVEPSDLGLRADAARRMSLGLAWREVAGPVLSRLARARLSRGTLEVEIEQPEGLPLVSAAIAEIAGRIAGRYPEFGVKRVRCRMRGEPPGATMDVRASPGEISKTARTEAPPRPERRAVETRPASVAELLDRLDRAARRHGRAKSQSR